MAFLRSVDRKAAADGGDPKQFPFSVPVIRSLESLDVSAPVSFFVGANGSGKSTMLEAIASMARLPAVGSSDVGRDETLAEQRSLERALRLTWHRRTHRGFFLRAEDFFGFTKRVAKLRAELEQGLANTEVEYRDATDLAKALAQGPFRRSLGELEQAYGPDLDAQSHGESFLALLRSRFVPGGLYLLDEPEAALSPQSQLGFLLLLGEMIEQSAQFIIATHSPIILAFPGARILSFDAAPAHEVAYDELEHVRLTRAFLNHPQQYLRHLWPESDGVESQEK